MDDARTVFLNCEEFNEDDSEVSHVKSEWRHQRRRSLLINLDSRISPCNGTAFYLLLSSLLERLINADTIMSPQVGQAGKRLFEFFERRWEQLAPNMD